MNSQPTTERSYASTRPPLSQTSAPLLSLNTKLHSTQIERDIIGACIVSEKALAACSFANVEEADFHAENLRIIWRVIQWFQANSLPIDGVALSERLKQTSVDLTKSELAQIFTGVEDTFIRNITLHIATLKEYAQKRRLSDFATNLALNIDTHLKSPQEALQTIQTQVAELTIAGNRKKRRTTLEIAESALKLLDDRIQGVFNGVQTGIAALDDALDGGLANGTLTILGARPGMGKSIVCSQIATNIATKQKKNVVIASYEMKAEIYLWRMACGIAGENWKSKHHTPETVQKLTSKMAEIARSGVQVWDDSTMNAMQLQLELEELNRYKPVDLLIVDFIQRIPAHAKYSNRKDLEIGEVSMKLKDMAMKFNIPVLAVSSLNRKSEERADKRPLLSDLRESGSLESDADVVIGLYRPEEDTIDGRSKLSDTRIEANFLKAREGALSMLTLGFNGEYSQVWDLEAAMPQMEEGRPF